jgi:cytidylate kinase
MRFVVAIDGPAAAGKGTIARAVAARFGFAHLDTGLLYRAVGKKALDQGRGVLDGGVAALVAGELTPADLDAEGLRGAMVSRAASKAAAIPEVRQALLDFQRRFAARDGGAVLDGRDIATVICPDADVKLFVVAGDQTRARRRLSELLGRGDDATLTQVLADLRSRDARDAGRDAAPMRQAEDSHLLDTTELAIDAAVDEATRIIEQALDRG